MLFLFSFTIEEIRLREFKRLSHVSITRVTVQPREAVLLILG